MRTRTMNALRCRSGKHVRWDKADREKCCNGFRRTIVITAWRGQLRPKFAWKAVSPGDPSLYPWEREQLRAGVAGV